MTPLTKMCYILNWQLIRVPLLGYLFEIDFNKNWPQNQLVKNNGK